MPGRSRVPLIRVPVIGLRFRHIVVVRVQPIRRTTPATSEVSTFWPTPVVLAQCSAASNPPNASSAQDSSATDTMPVRMDSPGPA